MREMMTADIFIRSGILAAIVCLGLGSQAAAQATKPATPAPTARPESKPEPSASVDAEPTSIVSSFGDWILRCQRLGTGAESQHLCEVAQQIRSQDKQTPLAELAIGRLKKTDPLRLTIVLPVNITISAAPSFTIDDKVQTSLDLGWRKCLPGGCIADALVKDDVMRRWNIQNSGRIKWTDAAGHDLAIGLSFRGLAQALDALTKEP
jgi:invasion protein IalB